MTSESQHDSFHHALAGCGERLRAGREAAGLSVDDVAAKLHMPARVVRSLESENWSTLGAPVFVRGQVRSYSRLLGLTTAQMMDALDVGPVEPSRLVSRTHTPRAQWWAEQVGRRLVYIVLTLSLAIPAWVATRQHLSATAPGSVPLIEAEAAAWLVRSNAYTQWALAELMRVRSAQLAHDSTQMKFGVTTTTRTRGDLNQVLQPR